MRSESEKAQDIESIDEWNEYGCEFCDQVFANSNDMLEHRETHNEAQE